MSGGERRSPPVFETFGCRLNAHESAAMAEMAAEAGLSGAVVVNTCAVTNEAVRQARQRIRRLRAENPSAPLIVTGCAAQIDPAGFSAMPEVDLVLGNAEKMTSASWRRLAEEASAGLIGQTEPVRVNDIFADLETAPHLVESSGGVEGFGGRARATVQVQNGCDHRCTFCIIPYGRGNARSAPAGVVVEQIRKLVDSGYQEVVLTGVDLTSWGGDLPGRPPLGDLVQRILKLVPDLPRLRLSSLDSVEADPALIDAVTGDARVAPHLHLSLQSGDDMILKRMKRRHLSADAEAFCAAVRARRSEVAFGADIIAGFPTETEAMFENSVRHVDACGLTYLHVFPFSPREGAPAARMPQTPKAAIKERAARLRAVGAERLGAYLRSRVGALEDALIESAETARTAAYAPVRLDAPVAPAMVGRIAPVQVTGAGETGLTGRRLAEAAQDTPPKAALG